jgi:hypothetical protein
LAALGGVASPVRIVEQAQAPLQRQYAVHRLVDRGGCHPSSVERNRQAVTIGASHHIDIDARIERKRRGLREVRGNAVVDELPHRVVVADDDAVETQPTAQPPLEQSGIRGHGYAREIVERGHDRRHSRRHGGGKWRKIHFSQGTFRDVRGRVVASGDRRAIGAVMLGNGGKRACSRKVAALETAHFVFGDTRGQPRILAGALGDASPTRIPRHIEHRGEGQGQAVGGSLLRRLTRGKRPNIGVEYRRFRQWDRKYRPISMHHIESQEQWNTEPRFLHRQALHLASMVRPDQIEQIADGARANRIGRISRDGRSRDRISGSRHGELTELLRERHLADQPIDMVHGNCGHRAGGKREP